jgi:hypothetical protein
MIIRGKSDKPIIPIEDLLYPFVFDVDGKGNKIYPASPAHFFVLKQMSVIRKFFNRKEHDYDPFE